MVVKPHKIPGAHGPGAVCGVWKNAAAYHLSVLQSKLLAYFNFFLQIPFGYLT